MDSNLRWSTVSERTVKGPTTTPPSPPGMSSVLERNMQALQERRLREESSATFEDRIAQAITRFTGSMRFVYIHVAIFGAWILCNVGLIPGAPRFDPSLVILAMVASVEAIFLSTFVLISQNRISAAADRRAELDLQVSLLAEHEITKLVGLVRAIAEHQGLDVRTDAELDEIQRDIAPEVVLDEIEAKTALSES